MSLPRLVPIVAALATVVLAGGSSCDVTRNRLEDGLVRPDRVGEVRISGRGGDVTVTADSTVIGVDVRRFVRYAHQAPGESMRVGGAILFLSTECGPLCNASYEVRLPNGARVTGDNGSGSVVLRGVSDVDLTVDSGDVEVSDASGTVAVRARSGDITLTGIVGAFTAITSSGNITGRALSGPRGTVEARSGDISLDLPGTSDVAVRVSSGDVDIRVPDRRCRIVADTSSGEVEVGAVADPASAHLLEVHASSGDISITSSV